MKVFSLEKYKEDMGYTDEQVSNWAKKVAGWTLEDIQAKTLFGVADAWLEEVNMTKEYLKDGDIVTLRNGDRLVLYDGWFKDCSEENSNRLIELNDLDNELNCIKCNGRVLENDIVKVERPVEYETVFKREEAQELTVDEISERLGYKVKVVGEDR